MLLNRSTYPNSVPSKWAGGQIFSNSPILWYRRGSVCTGVGWCWCTLLALVLLASSRTLAAQSLSLSGAAATRGEEVALELSVDSPTGKEPLALQWDFSIPATLVMVSCAMPPGSEAERVGKTLKCAAAGKGEGTTESRCILAGGDKPIPNGPVAMVRLKISKEASAGAMRIRVGQGTAVSRDLKQVPLGPVEATVTVRK